MTPDTPSLHRFYGVLTEELREQRPDRIFEPFTVAEIYQELIPYRTHRDRIGVEMNGDYEHLLLRLLAGEDDLVVLESQVARARLREEVESPNPNTSLYRDFAAAEVRLNPERITDEVHAGEEAGAAEPEWRPEGAEPDLQEAGWDEEPVLDRETGEGAAAPVAGDPSTTTEEASTELPETCVWCRADLPQRPNLNYCPFCGTDVRLVPCEQCGEELEPEWLFCIACGTAVTTS